MAQFTDMFASYNQVEPVKRNDNILTSTKQDDLDFFQDFTTSFNSSSPSKKEEDSDINQYNDWINPKTKVGNNSYQQSIGTSQQITNSSDDSDLNAALQLISREERGVSWETPFQDKLKGNNSNNELSGYQLKGEGHKTYGFGLVYSPDGKLMEDLAREQPNGIFTEDQMRKMAIDKTKQHLAKIDSYNIKGLTKNQKAVLAHQFHASPKTGKYFMERIKKEGIPTSEQFYKWKEELFKTYKNWNLYGKGWMNGARREAELWNA